MELVLFAVLEVAKKLVSGFENRCTVRTLALVEHGEVDVAGDELSEMFKELLSEHFRHNVGTLFSGGDGNKLD